MELRLQKLIESIERLADIRNQDDVNLVSFTLPHPDPSVDTQHVMIAATVEPTYINMPLNAIWIVMNPDHPYYRQALQLKAFASRGESGVKYAVPGTQFSWIHVQRYERAFDPQEWLDAGRPGPKGPKGDPGITWAGIWSSLRTYARGEAVRFKGGSYVSLVENNVNIEPITLGSNWMLLAAPGGEPYVDYDALAEEVRIRLGWPSQT